MKKILYLIFVLTITIYGQTNTENYIQETVYNTEIKNIPSDHQDFSISSGISDFLISGSGGGGGFSSNITNNVLKISFSGGWDPGRLKLGRAKILPINPPLKGTIELGDMLTSGKPNGFKAKLRNNELILYSKYYVGGIITNIRKQIPGNNSYNWEHISLDGLVAKCPGGNKFGEGHLIIRNDGSIDLNVQYNENISGLSNCGPYLGVIKTLTGQTIPDMELGALRSNKGDYTIYKAKIKNRRLIFYSAHIIKGVSSTLTKQIPGNNTINYSASLGNPYECNSGGGGGGSSSISITNGTVKLNMSAGWDLPCNLKLGQIKYLSTSTIPNIELGTIKSNQGDETIYKAKIENNWLVYYTNELVPIYPRNGGLSATIDLNIGENQQIKTVTYHDGLGRPKQEIVVRGGGQKQDIITHYDYDTSGRQEKEFLPYAKTSTGGNIKPNSLNEVKVFYNTAKYENTKNPFIQKKFDVELLNRVLKQAAPGESWKFGNGHEMQYDYLTNAQREVRLFKVTFANNNTQVPQLVSNTNSFYNPGQLYKTITYNENHPGTTTKNHTREEFKDKEDRLILKRTYADIDINNDGTLETEVPHDTYYVYDAFGNLTFIIPPKVNTTDGISTTELNKLCYQYRYDSKNRIIEKLIPGKGDANTRQYIVYNKLNRAIMTQDPKLKAENKWLFTVYDVFERIAYTGIDENNTASRATLQNAANAASKQYVTKTGKNTYAGTDVYYSKNAYPVSFDKVYSINYYDDYVFDHNVVNPQSVFGQAVTGNTKSLRTGTKVRVVGTNHWITTVTYFDYKARPIYVHTANTYLNTTEIVENKYDFTGNILKTRTSHQKGTNTKIITIDTYTYDNMNRLLTHRQCIGNGSSPSNCGDVDPNNLDNAQLSETITTSTNEVANNTITLLPGFHATAASNLTFSASIAQVEGELIVANTYDELGKLNNKKVGNTLNKPLQQVDYAYNIRGWLKGVNQGTTANGDLFGYTLKYNSGANPLYNGNVSSTSWKTSNDNITRSYSYTYDALNRITSGISNDNKYNLSRVTYDKNGNIRNLDRKGHLNTNATSFGDMDKLVYLYDDANRLLKVTDNGNDTFGFKDGTNTNIDFTYDANGNLTLDRNKGITEILYNHQNLPTKVTVSGSENGNIRYVYDATGSKIRKITTKGNAVTTTDYTGNYVYKNGNLDFLNHPEGYIESENDGSFTYVYQYKDQIKNVRLSYSDRDNDGKVDQVRNNTDVDGDGDNTHEILHERNYYPFGLEHKGYNDAIRGVKNNRKTFQDQELTEDLALNIHEWKYRVSDPSIGRFWQIDPLAEDYVYNGTYNFSENRVVDAVELEGLEKVSIHFLGEISLNDRFINVLGSINLDIGNNNFINYGIAIEGIGTISGTFSEDGRSTQQLSENNIAGNRALAWSITKPGGVKIPDFIAKYGIEKAKESINPETIEEALSMSEDEADLNRLINTILDQSGALIDADIADAYLDYDGSASTAKNEKGETYKRKFTRIYRGQFKNFEISIKGIDFKGEMLINYTDQKCVDNCND